MTTRTQKRRLFVLAAACAAACSPRPDRTAGEGPLPPAGARRAPLDAAASAPLVSADFAVDGPVYRPGNGDQRGAAVSSDGASYFVAWMDGRTSYDSSTIYGARVGADGKPIDKNGIRLSEPGASSPSIAYNGRAYLVVWAQRYASDLAAIVGALVGPDGAPIGTPFSISSTGALGPTPAVASDGDGFLVAWEDEKDAGAEDDIYGARVSAAGQVLDPSGLVLAKTDALDDNPSLGYDGSNYALFWTKYTPASPSYLGDVYGARVGRDGALLDTTPRPIAVGSTSDADPTAAWSGSSWLVAWSRAGAVRGALFDAALSPSGASFALSSSAENASDPHVTNDGPNFFVSYTRTAQADQQENVFATRVTAAGVVQSPQGVPIAAAPSREYNSAVAQGAGGHVVVWTDWRSGSQSDVFGARVYDASQVLDPGGFNVSTMTNEQRLPALACGGAECLVAWADDRDGGSDVLARRVGFDGTPLGTSAFAIAADPDLTETSPAVAWDGARYLVAWGGVEAAYVGADGALQGQGPVKVGEGDSPAVTASKGGAFVAWGAPADATSADTIRGSRLAQDGTPLDAGGTVIAESADLIRLPRVATLANQYVVVWADGGETKPGAFAARVDASGAVLDPGGISLKATGSLSYPPSIDCSPAQCLVAWADNDGVAAVRLAPNGDILDATPVVLSTAALALGTAVSWNGSSYLVGWSRDGGPNAFVARRVGENGTPLDAEPFELSASAQQAGLAAAALPDNRWMLAYSALRSDDPALGTYRVNGRLVQGDAPCGLLPGCGEAGAGGSAAGGGAGAANGAAGGGANAGAAGTEGADSGDSGDDDGCGCRVAGGPGPNAWALALGALGLLRLRRRRAAREAL